MRRVSLASASPMQTRRPNPKGTNCSFLTKRTPPSYFSRNLQKKFTDCFSSRTTFQVWTHEAAPTRPGPGWEFIHVDDNVFHIWWTFKVQSDNISKILLQNKERDDAFFYSGKDLHEASKVCQGKRVPWDLITLQSHIFCHPIREIYAIWPKWFWKLTKIVREIKLMRTCVELSEGQHRKVSAPPEWLPAKKPIMRKRATKKLRLITKKSSGWNKLEKLCRCNIRVSFALEKF